jgi:hypothetical protein
MSTEFTIKNTPQLTKLVTEGLTGAPGSYEETKYLLRTVLGMPSPATEEAQYGRPDDAPQAASSMPAAEPGEPRDVRVLYLKGNSRFEIEGTQAQLDAQEAALRALYQ